MANNIIFVIAKEHINLVMDEWKDKKEQKRNSDSKKEKSVLIIWKKMIMSLKIRKRVQKAYGGDGNRQLRRRDKSVINGPENHKKSIKALW